MWQAPPDNRQALNNRQEHTPGPRRGARHRRRDHGLANRQPIAQPQRAPPQPLDEVSGDPITEPRLDEPASEEEGDDDKPDDLVGECPESRGES